MASALTVAPLGCAAGVDADSDGDDGASFLDPDAALMMAAMTGDLDAASVAIARGGLPTRSNVHGISPLLVVCGGVGPPPLLRALLRAPGVDVDTRDASGWTPLIYVASSGIVSLVDELLSAGADVNAVATDRGWTAVTRAAYRGHAPTLVRLLAVGGDATARADGRTALEWAVEGGHADAAAVLRDHVAGGLGAAAALNRELQ